MVISIPNLCGTACTTLWSWGQYLRVCTQGEVLLYASVINFALMTSSCLSHPASSPSKVASASGMPSTRYNMTYHTLRRHICLLGSLPQPSPASLIASYLLSSFIPLFSPPLFVVSSLSFVPLCFSLLYFVPPPSFFCVCFHRWFQKCFHFSPFGP